MAIQMKNIVILKLIKVHKVEGHRVKEHFRNSINFMSFINFITL